MPYLLNIPRICVIFNISPHFYYLKMDALRRSSRISRKERINNVTIRQQIGLEEIIVKEIEQNQLTWYGQVQRMAKGSIPKIALKLMSKQK